MRPWRELTEPDEIAERLIGLYELHGNDRYDEAVTQTQHAVQTAELAHAAGADRRLIAAALLHDVGHLLRASAPASVPDRPSLPEHDWRHEEVAARLLSRWFDPELVEPIRHHVDAKRFLCALDPAYHETLSCASVRSLELQGGPMTAGEIERFERTAGTAAGVALRRWDDLAKDPGRVVPTIGSFHPLIADLVRSGIAP